MEAMRALNNNNVQIEIQHYSCVNFIIITTIAARSSQTQTQKYCFFVVFVKMFQFILTCTCYFYSFLLFGCVLRFVFVLCFVFGFCASVKFSSSHLPRK